LTLAPGLETVPAMGTWDQFAKEIIPSVLAGIGLVETAFETHTDAQQIDVWSRPAPGVDWDAEFQRLGWLARLAEEPCIIEPYSTTVTERDVRTCLRKQLTLEHMLLKSDENAPLPRLWLLSAGDARQASEEYRLETQDDWPQGFRFAAAALRLCIVVLSELPKGRSTVPLRLLGRGTTLADAVAEVRALPEDDPMRRPMAEVLAQRRFAALQFPSEDEKAEAEMLQQEWQAFKDKVREEGREEGREEERRALVQRQLTAKFGTLDAIVVARLDAADLKTLELYAVRLVAADTLDEVFAE
jgi:hypothetical protein